MRSNKILNVALVGNPNTGKTSLFNQLTGLNQKVGNYPGITVDKKQGICKLSDSVKANIIDLPGTYSINPNTIDESIVLETLINKDAKVYPDVVIIVADVVNIKRNLLLFSQVKDLGIPTILAINMSDQLEKKGIVIDVDLLKKELNSDIVLISARKKIGINELKKAILNPIKTTKIAISDFSNRMDTDFFNKVKSELKNHSLYTSWLMITQLNDLSTLSKDEQKSIEKFREDDKRLAKLQHKETVLRYQQINEVLKKTYNVDQSKATTIRAKLDRVLTHKVFGYVIFAFILMLMFQSVFAWSETPMNWIDEAFAKLSDFTKSNMAKGKFADLLVDGIIAGINGVIIFIPQIAILFLFVSILEETGYMSRAVFLMDKIMRKFGMSGKSIIPLVSGVACAIPAIMSARNIENWKERLITILVTPFTTCGARLPVYAILIGLVIPEKSYFGVFNLQGLTLLGLYFLGFIAALISGYILNKMFKAPKKSYFVIELPDYRAPSIKNIGITVIEKTKAFVIGAGKIILAISIIIWFLQTNGGKEFKNAEEIVKSEMTIKLSDAEFNQKVASFQSEHSYLGTLGKVIEPIVEPLGYDWKMGIGILTSFAAREVFVGTMATIYSVEDDGEENIPLQERMSREINAKTGGKAYTLASGLSLLIFYAFAMQCMGTLAIVKRETNSWKWPIYQFVGMTIIAYVAAFLTFIIVK